MSTPLPSPLLGLGRLQEWVSHHWMRGAVFRQTRREEEGMCQNGSNVMNSRIVWTWGNGWMLCYWRSWVDSFQGMTAKVMGQETSKIGSSYKGPGNLVLPIWRLSTMFLSISYYISQPFQSSRSSLKVYGVQELSHAGQHLKVRRWMLGLNSTADQILQEKMGLWL